MLFIKSRLIDALLVFLIPINKIIAALISIDIILMDHLLNEVYQSLPTVPNVLFVSKICIYLTVLSFFNDKYR